MKLIYKFVNFEIAIELIDNPFIVEWIAYLKRTATRLPDIKWGTSTHNMYMSTAFPDPILRLQELYISFDYLNSNTQFDFSEELPILQELIDHPADVTQSMLNRWHRHFTTVATEYYATNSKLQQTDEMFHMVHGINQNVHDLEFLTYPKSIRRSIAGTNKQYSIFCADARNLDGSNALWIGGHTEAMKFEFDPITNEYHYDVWINEDIQGKDHIKAWLDDDNLTESDIWGNSFMTPNVMFAPSMLYATVLDNPEFQAEYVASGKKLNRWPLGTLVNKHDISWSSLGSFQLVSINIDDEVLWKIK